MRGAFRRVASQLATAAGGGPASGAGTTGAVPTLRAAFASYASPGTTGTPAPRRVPTKPRAGAGAAAADGAAGTTGIGSGGGPMMAEMSREVPGGAKPMQSWERWYWGIGVGGVSAWLFWRLKPDGKTAEEIEEERRKAAELELKRKDHLRSVLAAQRGGGFIAEGEDPLDGLSPRRIEQLMEEAGIDPRDPLEGMSPEEIDEYMRRQDEATEAASSSSSS